MPPRNVPFYIVTAPGRFDAEKALLIDFFRKINTALEKKGRYHVEIKVLDDPYCAEDCLRFFCRAEYPVTMVVEHAPEPSNTSLCYPYTHMDTLSLYALLCLRAHGLTDLALWVRGKCACLDDHPVLPLLWTEPFANHPALSTLKEQGADDKLVDEAMGAILYYCLQDMLGRMGDGYSPFRANSFSLFWQGDCYGARRALRSHEALAEQKGQPRYGVDAHFLRAAIAATEVHLTQCADMVDHQFRQMMRYLPSAPAITAFESYIVLLIRKNRKREALAVINLIAAIDPRDKAPAQWKSLREYLSNVEQDTTYHANYTQLLRHLNRRTDDRYLFLLADAYVAYLGYLLSTDENAVAQIWTIMLLLAQTYHQQKDFRAELATLQALHQDRCRHLGENSPAALTTLKAVAMAHTHLGDWDTAIPLMEDVYARRCAAQGDTHPETLATISTIVSLYRTTKNTPQQLEWLERLYAAQCRAYGPDHGDTQATLKDIHRLRGENN